MAHALYVLLGVLAVVFFIYHAERVKIRLPRVGRVSAYTILLWLLGGLLAVLFVIGLMRDRG